MDKIHALWTHLKRMREQRLPIRKKDGEVFTEDETELGDYIVHRIAKGVYIGTKKEGVNND